MPTRLLPGVVALLALPLAGCDGGGTTDTSAPSGTFVGTAVDNRDSTESYTLTVRFQPVSGNAKVVQVTNATIRSTNGRTQTLAGYGYFSTGSFLAELTSATPACWGDLQATASSDKRQITDAAAHVWCEGSVVYDLGPTTLTRQ